MKVIRFTKDLGKESEMTVILNAERIQYVSIYGDSQTYIGFELAHDRFMLTQGESEVVMMAVYNELADFLGNADKGVFDVAEHIIAVLNRKNRK